MVNRTVPASIEPLKLVLRRTEFLSGAASLGQLPPDTGTEVAFAGRSNAGKSSALNAVTHRKGLARISKTPGRTQQLNVYAVDASRRLVDLPGYGFARAPSDARARWSRTVEAYLRQRRSLRGLVLIMDIRHIGMPSDQALLDWAAETRMPVHVLLSKADKLTSGPAHAALHALERRLSELRSEASAQIFSALARRGIEECQWRIARWLELPGAVADSDPRWADGPPG